MNEKELGVTQEQVWHTYFDSFNNQNTWIGVPSDGRHTSSGLMKKVISA